jgi:hypothetical protein
VPLAIEAFLIAELLTEGNEWESDTQRWEIKYSTIDWIFPDDGANHFSDPAALYQQPQTKLQYPPHCGLVPH